MELTKRRTIVAGFSLLFVISLLWVAFQMSQQSPVEAGTEAIVAARGEECVDCHAKENPALVMEWAGSVHAENDVGCIECHTARPPRQRTRSRNGHDKYDRTAVCG